MLRKLISIKTKIAHPRNELAQLINICQILTYTFTLNRLPVNVFTLCIIIKYYFIAGIYFEATTPDLDPPNRAKHISPIFAISGLFIKIKSRFLIYFTILTYKVKFNYSLRTSSHTCLNTKGVSSYFGSDIL